MKHIYKYFVMLLNLIYKRCIKSCTPTNFDFVWISLSRPVPSRPITSTTCIPYTGNQKNIHSTIIILIFITLIRSFLGNLAQKQLNLNQVTIQDIPALQLKYFLSSTGSISSLIKNFKSILFLHFLRRILILIKLKPS